MLHDEWWCKDLLLLELFSGCSQLTSVYRHNLKLKSFKIHLDSTLLWGCTLLWSSNHNWWGEHGARASVSQSHLCCIHLSFTFLACCIFITNLYDFMVPAGNGMTGNPVEAQTMTFWAIVVLQLRSVIHCAWKGGLCYLQGSLADRNSADIEINIHRLSLIKDR